MFFKEIEAIQQFSEIVDISKYKLLPDSWFIFISDVVNSTIAIQNGNYRNVNVLGAAPIIAILREYDWHEIPFIFGGDGVSICIPPEKLDRVTEIFSHTQWIAQQEYGLELRAGFIQASKVKEAGHPIRVGKLKISDYYNQALFYGGGLSLVDSWLKKEHSLLTRIQPKQNMTVHYDGLECRWQPVKSSMDFTISLLVKPVSGNSEKDLETLKQFVSVYEKWFVLPDSHPIQADQMSMFKRFSQLASEAKLRTVGESLTKRIGYKIEVLLRMFIGWIMMSKKIATNTTAWGDYKDDVSSNSDFKKYDDIIRLVISCKKDQLVNLENWLEEKFKAKELVYGIHKSDSALITCMVFKYQKEHIHFVDGNNGGYAVAAKDLKRRLSQI